MKKIMFFIVNIEYIYIKTLILFFNFTELTLINPSNPSNPKPYLLTK
jgi:hypothetical protein